VAVAIEAVTSQRRNLKRERLFIRRQYEQQQEHYITITAASFILYSLSH
jgi:hypothetical protein